MTDAARMTLCTAFACLVLAIIAPTLTGADASEQAPPSSYAPAELLATVLEDLHKSIQKSVASEDSYTSNAEAIDRDVSFVAAICLILASHDEDHAFKQSALDRVAWARRLAEASDYATAKTAAEKMIAGEATPPEHADSSMQVSTSLTPMMKHVSRLGSGVRRNVSSSRFKRRAQDSAEQAVLIAVTGQAAIYHGADYVEDDKQHAQWKSLSVEMRDSAGAAVQALLDEDQVATQAALARLEQSCQQCHELVGVEAE